jgi:hypothetical protein
MLVDTLPWLSLSGSRGIRATGIKHVCVYIQKVI